MLQLGDAVFHIGAPPVAAPDLLGRLGAASDEDAESIAGHVDQLAAYALTAFAYLLANDRESPLDAPAVQLEPELACRVVVVHRPRLVSTTTYEDVDTLVRAVDRALGSR